MSRLVSLSIELAKLSSNSVDRLLQARINKSRSYTSQIRDDTACRARATKSRISYMMNCPTIKLYTLPKPFPNPSVHHASPLQLSHQLLLVTFNTLLFILCPTSPSRIQSRPLSDLHNPVGAAEDRLHKAQAHLPLSVVLDLWTRQRPRSLGVVHHVRRV